MAVIMDMPIMKASNGPVRFYQQQMFKLCIGGELQKRLWVSGGEQGRIQPVVFSGVEGQLVGPRQTLPTPNLGFLLGFRPLYLGSAQK